MPIAQMKTNLKMNDVSKKEFLDDIAGEMAKLLKKPMIYQTV